MKNGLVGVTLLASMASPAWAQDSSAQGEGLQDIVVTARKKSERLQDVPVAVSVATGQDLINRSVQSFRDLQAQTPSLKMVQASNSPSSLFLAIRGQTNADIRLNADLAVGFYVDGVYSPRAIGIEGSDLDDIDRVEILKGPQGTLFGRNTTGGAITIYTKAPVDHWEGGARLGIANFGVMKGSAYLNAPLGDTLAARIAVSTSQRDGYGNDRVSGESYGNRDVSNGRLALAWRPNDALTVTLRGNYGRAISSAQAWKPVSMIAGSTANRAVAAETGLSQTAARDLYLSYSGGDRNTGVRDNPFGERVTYGGVSGTIDWDLGGVTLKSITAWQKFHRFTKSDLDGSPFALFQYTGIVTEDRQFSQELQLSGSLFDGKVSWITGGYYSDEKGFEDGSQITTRAISATWPSITYGATRNRTWGVFAQGDWEIVDSLSFTGGVRYTEDKRELTSRNRTRTTCTALGVPLAGVGNCEYVVPSVNYDAISYTAGLDYKVRQGLLLYVKTSRGYRSGGLPLTGGSTVSPAAAALTYTPFRPESVTDYEAGLKADWFGQRLRTNIALFHSNYKDVQRSVSQFFPGIGNLALTQNAANGKIDGVETEITAVPVRELELRATGAWTKARFKDYVVNGVDLSSTPFVFTPKWSYSLSGAYTAPLDFGSLRAQIDYTWDSRMATSGRNGFRRSLGLLSARLALNVEEAGLNVAVFGRNLTNERYNAYAIDQSSLGIVVAMEGEPRTYGLELSKSF